MLYAKIPASPEKSYPIFIGNGLLHHADWLPKKLSFNQIVVITDHHVKKLYADDLIKTLKKSGYNPLLLSFPPGEKSKTHLTKQTLENSMLKNRCGRDTLCIALGGGIVGDITGYLSATYMRGIPYIQIPTTLLSMIDSSVGGKTGINTAYGKNLIGAYWQPKAVIADIHCLKSLSKKQKINGLIEAIKIFLTCDAKSFFYLKNHLPHILAGDEKVLTKIISRAVKIKSDIVCQDEKEQNERRILNFGHTIGHAIEKISDYQILHGFSVALGILVEAKISQLLGLLSAQDYDIIKTTLASLGIHESMLKKFNVTEMIQATQSDKKTIKQNIPYILFKKIGEIHLVKKQVAHLIPEKTLKNALRGMTL